MSAQGLKPPAASEVSREDGELPVLVTQHVDFPSESAALGPAAHAEGPRGRCSPSHSVGLGCSPGAGTQGAPPRRLPWPPDSPPFVLASALPPQAPLHAHAPRLRMAVRVAGVCLSHSRRDPVGPGAERPSPVPALLRRAPGPDPPPTAPSAPLQSGKSALAGIRGPSGPSGLRFRAHLSGSRPAPRKLQTSQSDSLWFIWFSSEPLKRLGGCAPHKAGELT